MMRLFLETYPEDSKDDETFPGDLKVLSSEMDPAEIRLI